MNDLKERLLTLLYPHKCFMCGKVLADTNWLCGACELPITADELCHRCGKRREECLCRELPPIFTGVCAPFYYTGGVRHGIHHFKYKGRAYYAGFLAEQMARKIRTEFPEVVFDVVTWVPLHPRKQRQRGYCPTEKLARIIARRRGEPVSGAYLLHTGKGGTQMSLKNRASREENARASFAGRAGVNLAGKTVLLVDDVLTTGATLRRCGSLLLKLGASSVYGVTAAVTRRKGKDRQC